jgi:putative endonuclease
VYYGFYILFSEIKNKYYIGFTSNIERLKDIISAKGFTGAVNDWKLVHTENYFTKEQFKENENES